MAPELVVGELSPTSNQGRLDHQSRTNRIEFRAMLFCGGAMLASGLIHAFVFALVGGEWEGNTSLRKPILFGVSTGVTMFSLAWVTSKLPRRPTDALLLTAFSLALLLEVALITLQQWRGVPSHFNRSTVFDANVLVAMEVLILFATLMIGAITWRVFFQLDAPPDMRLAIRSGMLLLFVGCALGIVAVVYGYQQLSEGRPPETYGNAGVMKFAHGMPLHAIQYLPFVAWVFAKLRVPTQQRTVAVGLASGSLVLLTVFSCWQTFSGRARFDLEPLGVAMLAAAATLSFAAMLACVYRSFSWLHRPRQA